MYKPTNALALGASCLALTYLLDGFPEAGKLLVLCFLTAEGLRRWCEGRRSGALLLSASVLFTWVTLASYPLAFSKSFDTGVIYVALTAGIILPWCFFGMLHKPGLHLIVLWCVLAVLVCMSARPGRRFAGEANHPRIVELAQQFDSIEETTAYVHQTIERRKGPATDTAVDTLKRGYGHCGAMNNLLHKLLTAQGYDAQIIHLSGNNIHTLVYVDGQFADAQENLVQTRPLRSLLTIGESELPKAWTGHDTLWIYRRGTGYLEINEAE